MKKALTIVAVGAVCFLLGTIGVFFAMPSLSPEQVDKSMDGLDSLGALNDAAADSVVSVLEASASASGDSVIAEDASPTPGDVIHGLRDSIQSYVNTVRSLSSDTASLSAQITRLKIQIDDLTAKEFEASELSKSLAKLDAKQLGGILAGLDLATIERLYEKASARDRTRLLESMSPDQAARFVHTLVQGPGQALGSEPESPDDVRANAAEPPAR